MPHDSLTTLENWFRSCPFACVAFSGGVDSSLTAWLARHFLGRERVRAVISASPSLKLSELEAARALALEWDLPLQIIRTKELDNPDYYSNPANRCYFCKDHLYDALEALPDLPEDAWLINGTNTDDRGDYRPGLEAATQHQVRSPLAECGLDKDAVRALARHLKLSCWDKPASPCLSSRIPYGQEVTHEKLRRIEAAEALLQAAGFPILRVRHDTNCARIEVPAKDIPALKEQLPALESRLHALGFGSIMIDPEGFVSGKLNRSLTLEP